MPNRAFTTSHALPPIGDGPPSAATAQRAQSVKVYTSSSHQTNLGAVLRDTQKPKVLILFIRHFFCGNCQEYIKRITSLLPPSSLPSNLGLIIIGCGAPSLIESYIELTQCPYPIYADPKTKLYKVLGMHRSLSLGTRSPSYIQHSLISGMMKSVVQGVQRIGKGDVSKAGDLSVNGGEFLFWLDGGVSTTKGLEGGEWKVGWCHRMQNSRDHTEIDELRRHVGLGSSEGSGRRVTTSNLSLTRRMSRKLTGGLIRGRSSQGVEQTGQQDVREVGGKEEGVESEKV